MIIQNLKSIGQEGSVKHFVAIRFNLDRGKGCHLDSDWINGRLLLLKNECANSLSLQTCKDFQVIVLIHKDTSEKTASDIVKTFKDIRLDCHILRATNLLSASIAMSKFLSQFDSVISSRIDTDDRYSKYYIQKVQSFLCNIDDEETICVDFKKIIYKSQSKVNIYNYPATTMFLSIRSRDPLKHCFFEQHDLIKTRKVKVIRIDDIGGMINIHYDNIMNIMRGVPCKIDLSRFF